VGPSRHMLCLVSLMQFCEKQRSRQDLSTIIHQMPDLVNIAYRLPAE